MRFFLLFLIVLPIHCFSQDESKYTVVTIPTELTENANAVIRKNFVHVIIEDYDKVSIETDRIVNVLNERGDNDVNAYESYDPYVKIKKISAIVYDRFGQKIQKFKKSDFTDVSAVASGSLYTDNRVLYLNYTPRSYPYTIQYKSTTIHKNTAFLPSWFPIEDFYVSTESSDFIVENKSDVKLRIAEENLESYNGISKDGLSYSAKDLTAIRSEAYSPNFNTYAPHILMALEKFEMVGVDGVNEDWDTFGKWMHDQLLADVGEVPQSVKEEIKTLTQDLKTDREKAEAIYKFMQDRSRYISVQVGIGGWKPIDATEVHEKAYGDCKGLSNYTRSLLNEVGIKSNHVIIYGGGNIRDIKDDFSSTQGNHMILHIPKLDNEENIYLECTSKTAPFGFIAGFTDDRDALIVNESGGKILHTTQYPTELNKQITSAQILLEENGSASGDLQMESEGYQYSFRDHIDQFTERELKENYQKRWDYLNDFKIEEAIISKDLDSVKVKEKVTFSIGKAASKMGDILLINTVLFNRNNFEPPSYKDRKMDIDISRGYVDIDRYSIKLKSNMKVDALPKKVEFDTDFGSYKLEVSRDSESTIKVYRYLEMKKGLYDKDRYDEYEEFRNSIVRHDNSKAAIKL
ncbi:MAG: DUF3857 domain-containing protein [Nonlabens sp.]